MSVLGRRSNECPLDDNTIVTKVVMRYSIPGTEHTCLAPGIECLSLIDD
jgi:hypothetical protein